MRPHTLNCLLALSLLSFSTILLAKDAHLKPGADHRHGQSQATPPKTKAPAQEPTKPTADPALREQADKLYRAGQYEQAAKLYRQSAEQGDAVAQTALGTMCLNGQGVAKDVEQGVAWYVKAARLGNAAAQNNLGMLYEATKDYKQAMDWYFKAAAQDHADAQFNLGVMYEKSLGVQHDTTQAIAWYRKAVARGNEKARKHLVRLGVSAE